MGQSATGKRIQLFTTATEVTSLKGQRALGSYCPRCPGYALDCIFNRLHTWRVVEIVTTDEFRVWYTELDDDTAEDVTVSVDYLAVEGLRLGYPRSSAITGASFALRELRIQSKGRPIRVFYAFDPVRNAVLIIGGDKTGDNRFYDRLVPLAERIWKEYLDEIAQVE